MCYTAKANKPAIKEMTHFKINSMFSSTILVVKHYLEFLIKNPKENKITKVVFALLLV